MFVICPRGDKVCEMINLIGAIVMMVGMLAALVATVVLLPDILDGAARIIAEPAS